MSVTVPELCTAPPKEPAELSVRVESLIVSEPKLTLIAPPLSWPSCP